MKYEKIIELLIKDGQRWGKKKPPQATPVWLKPHERSEARVEAGERNTFLKQPGSYYQELINKEQKNDDDEIAALSEQLHWASKN